MSGGSSTQKTSARATGTDDDVDRGATAVEFALLFAFLFLPICFATISGGILFSDKLAITQGAREAARYGATLPYLTTTPTAFLTEVRQAALDAGYGELGSGEPSYCVAIRTQGGDEWRMEAGDSSAESGTCPGVSGLPARAHVLVSVTKPAVLDLLLYRFEPAISATSVARYEGES